MNRLSLGTAQFGMTYGVANKTGRVCDDELDNILVLASNNNIDSFDTAIAYGDAEKRLGDRHLNRNYHIVSKVGEIPHDCKNIREWLFTEVTNSQQRLKVDRLDGILLHRPQQLFSSDGGLLYKALLELKNNQMINKIGISVYFPDELALVMKNAMNMDIIQIPFNIIDSRFIRSGWLDRLYQQGIEIHVRSVFLQGLLLMSQDVRPVKFNRWQEIWKSWHAWLEQNQMTALEACLSYVLSFKQISKIIIGVDSSKQLMEILDAVKHCQNIVIPETLKIQDEQLLNPSYWGDL